MTSGSSFASPGGSAPFQCHTSVRPEFTSDPSSSAKHVDGSRKTSVWIFEGSTSLNLPYGFQKFEVSVSRGSIVTRNFSFESASITFPLCGAEARMLNPWQTYPFTFPWCMRSKTARTSYSLSSFGSHSNAQSFSFVATLPYQTFSSETWNLG